MSLMHLSVVDDLAQIPAAEWNALVHDDQPFLRHEFLAGLEASGCVHATAGWVPRHVLVHAAGPGRGRLLGAAPMYLKNHSYGEYVFDWAWANAYTRAGEAYYPKLVVGVPFTPVTGPRLLISPGVEAAAVRRALIDGAQAQVAATGASSLHWLFVTEPEAHALEAAGHLIRTGFQFHWANPGYRDFDDFLAGFTADKRKKIKRERRHVLEAGIEMAVLSGAEIGERHWDIFFEFYQSTIRAHGAYAYLSREFFRHLGRTLPDQVVLVLARRAGEVVAGALNLRGRDTLYGRYWGSRGDYHSLHFETCYYSAIEYCIAHGLKRFEAGAQGGHKLARGFTPVITRSAHRLEHPRFNRAVADYLARERLDVHLLVNELNEHAPFKKEDATSG